MRRLIQWVQCITMIISYLPCDQRILPALDNKLYQRATIIQLRTYHTRIQPRQPILSFAHTIWLNLVQIRFKQLRRLNGLADSPNKENVWVLKTGFLEANFLTLFTFSILIVQSTCLTVKTSSLETIYHMHWGNQGNNKYLLVAFFLAKVVSLTWEVLSSKALA